MAVPEVYGLIEVPKADVKVVVYRDRNDELYIEITDNSHEPLYVDVNDHTLTAEKDGYGSGTWDSNMKKEDPW